MTAQERLEEVYDMLVDETENPATLRNERKDHLLTHLLRLCEYLNGNSDDNPLLEWFDSASDNAVSPNELTKRIRELYGDKYLEK